MTDAAPSLLPQMPRLLPYIPRLLVRWQSEAPNAPVRQIQGTLVFVDIAGFTAMSEKLAAKGKVGAEEVTTILDQNFSRLLSVAWQLGGGLLKFGGDALLLFFSEEGHVCRAARAAYLMRRELSRSGRVSTSAGSVRLRMSVGLHSGNFHFFLAGDSHTELIIAGPAASRTVEMESIAEAGDILMSPESASLLPPGCVGEKKGQGFLLRRPPLASPIPGIDSQVPNSGFDLAAFVPEGLRTHLSTEIRESAHRRVAVAFVSFGGLDRVVIQAGDDEAQRRLNALVKAAQRAATDCQVCFLGTDIAADGGKIILSAGAPYTAGDDEGRILRAVRQIADAEYELDIRAGVNRGHVFAGEVGATFRRTYTVMGDAVNLAARLMARAEPGQVLATADVLEHSHVRFEATPLEPFAVKGKARPVTAFAVGQATGFRERYAGGLPLIGRERELRQLLDAAEEAQRGKGRYAVIIGDAGLGKSRLLAEVSGQSPRMRHLTAACEQYEASTAYFPFRDLLRSLVGADASSDAETAGAHLSDTVNRVAPELHPWLPLIAMTMDATVAPTREATELEPRFRPARTHAATADLLSKLLTTPTLLLIEDAHWMDDPSRGLLAELAKELERRPWLLCVTFRPTEAEVTLPPETPGLTIRLQPLDDKASGELVRAATWGLLPGAIATIAARAGGNPLFLREIVAAIPSQADVDVLPDSVEALITTRLDRLAPEDLLVLRYASVGGPSLSLGTLTRLLPAKIAQATGVEMWQRLSEFVAVERYTFTFKHALFRDVAYEALPFQQRRRLHESVGALLEEQLGDAAEGQAALLSLHFYRGQQNEKAWRYSLRAGRQAQEKFANLEAAEFYRRALEMGQRLPNVAVEDLAGVSECLGDVRELAGLFEEAAGAYRQARCFVRCFPERQPSLLLKEGVIRERRGRYSQALRFYRRALNSLPEGAGDGRAQRVCLGAAYAGVRFRQGRYAECLRWSRGVLAEAEEIGDKGNMAHAYYLMDLAYAFMRDKRPETSFALRALDIYEQLGDLVRQANVLNNLGIEAYFAGRWDEALHYYERSRKTRERSGDVIGAATATNNIGEVLSDQGLLDEAEGLFEEALQVWKAARYPIGVALATSNLGRLAGRRGRSSEAAELLSQALAGFRAIGAKSLELETEARVAESLALEGRNEAAAALARKLLARAGEEPGMTIARATLRRILGWTLLVGGDLSSAEKELHSAAQLARSSRVEYELALALQALSRLYRAMGRPGKEEQVESYEIFERLGVREVMRLPPLSRRDTPE